MLIARVLNSSVRDKSLSANSFLSVAEPVQCLSGTDCHTSGLVFAEPGYLCDSGLLDESILSATPDLDDNCEAQSLNSNLQFPSENEKPPLDNDPDCPEETPVIFGRWASVVPMDNTTYCQFSDVTGQPRAYMLPSASQARERYAQAMAFLGQQANSQVKRHKLGSQVAVEPATCLQDCFSDAVLDVRPLNNKCPKIAAIQLTSVVGANNTDGTNTHCADSSSCADSVDRHEPMVLATDNSDGCDVCPCCDLDTRDNRVSLSQSTEVTVAESDKDAINPRANLLPVAVNNPQAVRRTQDGRLDDIQSCTLIGRKLARACAERHVNTVFVSGPRARVVVIENGCAVVDSTCCCCLASCRCDCTMPKVRRPAPASGRIRIVNGSGSGGGAGTASSPMDDSAPLGSGGPCLLYTSDAADE